jgi:hypothetical protein
MLLLFFYTQAEVNNTKETCQMKIFAVYDDEEDEEERERSLNSNDRI